MEQARCSKSSRRDQDQSQTPLAWVGSEDMAPDCVDQWHQGCRCCAHPVCERRHIDVDAFALIDVALTIERQVQAVLGEQDMGKEPGTGTSTRDRVRGGRRLNEHSYTAEQVYTSHFASTDCVGTIDEIYVRKPSNDNCSAIRYCANRLNGKNRKELRCEDCRN